MKYLLLKLFFDEKEEKLKTKVTKTDDYYRAIRQAYLQNGGNDPDVLAQMAQMQAEAQAIEDSMNQKPPDKSPRG